MALLGMLAIVPLAAVATPWLLRLGSAGAADSAAASGQAHVGAVLVLLLLPQVPLYAIVGTATAVMNAHRRFALAAAAPALENLGTIAVLGVVAVLYARAGDGAERPALPDSPARPGHHRRGHAACERAMVGRPTGRHRPRAECRMA